MVMCYYGKVAIQRTTWREENGGRRFLGCVNWPQGCGFFMWVDPPFPVRAREVIYGLIRRLNVREEESRSLLKKIQRKEMIKFGVFLIVLAAFGILLSSSKIEDPVV